jgi:hypothetical protein
MDYHILQSCTQVTCITSISMNSNNLIAYFISICHPVDTMHMKSDRYNNSYTPSYYHKMNECWLHHIFEGSFTLPMAPAPCRWLDHNNKNAIIWFSTKLCKLFFVLVQRGGCDNAICTIKWASIYFMVGKSLKMCLLVKENPRCYIW